MNRYFISKYPTFGSYTHPIKWKIEESPYFYWWLALTLNNEYIQACAKPMASSFKGNKELKRIYEDFGDVRYEGDRHLAFTKWWTEVLPNGETRGAYLFAEPKTDLKTELVTDTDLAKQYADSDDELLIRVSKGMKREQIDKALNRIFKRHLEFEKGRQTRNPNRSNARYSLSKPISIKSLETAFKIVDLIAEAERNNKKISNFEIANQVGIKVEKQEVDGEAYWEDAYKRRVYSVAVSRKKKVAMDAIKSVVDGLFPS